jgi:hypothetical protein
MFGKDTLILEELPNGKVRVKFTPTELRKYKQLVGFSGTIDSSQMNILSPYLRSPKFLQIPNMKNNHQKEKKKTLKNNSLKEIIQYIDEFDMKSKII